MRTIILLTFLLAAVMATGTVCAEEPANKFKPNIVLILADDMGMATRNVSMPSHA